MTVPKECDGIVIPDVPPIPKGATDEEREQLLAPSRRKAEEYAAYFVRKGDSKMEPKIASAEARAVARGIKDELRELMTEAVARYFEGAAASKGEAPEVPTVEVERIDEVRGWQLSVVKGQSRPLIEDEVLGRKLGYADPVTVRKLIERIWVESNSRPPRATVPTQAGGTPRKPYLLNRRQAIKVTMRSDAPNADSIQEEILDVYEAWLDGRLVPSPAAVPEVIAQRIETAIRRDGEETRTLIGSVLACVQRSVELHGETQRAIVGTQQAIVELIGEIRSDRAATAQAERFAAVSVQPIAVECTAKEVAEEFNRTNTGADVTASNVVDVAKRCLPYGPGKRFLSNCLEFAREAGSPYPVLQFTEAGKARLMLELRRFVELRDGFRASGCKASVREALKAYAAEQKRTPQPPPTPGTKGNLRLVGS